MVPTVRWIGGRHRGEASRRGGMAMVGGGIRRLRRFDRGGNVPGKAQADRLFALVDQAPNDTLVSRVTELLAQR